MLFSLMSERAPHLILLRAGALQALRPKPFNRMPLALLGIRRMHRSVEAPGTTAFSRTTVEFDEEASKEIVGFVI
jgi:hypothetical protein